MCGTLNAKNGATVLGQVFDPTPWSFHDLCDEILGPRPEPKARVLDLATAKASRGERLRTGSIYDWWHLVYRDLLAIAEKHWFGGIPQGYRDQFLFLSSVALSWFAHTDTLEDELTRRAQTWTPGLKVGEVRDAISPAIQRARRAVAGEKVLFNGQERDPRYWYKRETLHGLMEPLIDAELAPTLLLSKREIQVLHWVKNGKTNQEIGQILGISPPTVKNHLQKIMRKLNVNNRAQAVGKCATLRLMAHSDLN